MNETSLSSLYRRLTATAAPAPESDDVGAKLAVSPAGAKLAAMLQELRTDSEALAFGIARVQRDSAVRPQRAPARRANVMRWTAAMAACLVAAVGVFALRQPHTMSRPAVQTVAQSDRIFSDRDLAQGKAPPKGDELFRGSFNG